jgi:hypothetical protein
MNQNEKELLLKDLCARLPYGVKVKLGDNPNIFDLEYRIKFAAMYGDSDKLEDILDITNIKPYLLPLSSMTEEQLKDLGTYYAKDSKIIIDNAIKSLESPLVMYKAAHVCFNTLEWYNKNHFDYRGLIEKGLAIDATGKNIY